MVSRDVFGIGGNAEACPDWVVGKEEMEKAVPGDRVGVVGGEDLGPELEEVAEHGGAARAALDLDEEYSLGRREVGNRAS